MKTIKLILQILIAFAGMLCIFYGHGFHESMIFFFGVLLIIPFLYQIIKNSK
jgi:hypothetical protein